MTDDQFERLLLSLNDIKNEMAKENENLEIISRALCSIYGGMG